MEVIVTIQKPLLKSQPELPSGARLVYLPDVYLRYYMVIVFLHLFVYYSD